jgi:hypothetical protein
MEIGFRHRKLCAFYGIPKNAGWESVQCAPCSGGSLRIREYHNKPEAGSPTDLLSILGRTSPMGCGRPIW